MGEAHRFAVEGLGAAAVVVRFDQDHLAGEIALRGEKTGQTFRIGNVLYRGLPFRPWRFTAADYLDAARGAEHAEIAGTSPFVPLRGDVPLVPLRGDVPLVPLRGNPVDAEWDGELRRAMEAQGVAVEEEAVVGDLLDDLTRGGSM